ncbi:MAG: glucose-1-phosphate thymidylyltransferase, partial [Planctomycetota bacterium]
MKGIILAGGLGTRLYPITMPIVKQLLPVYDKPMIYYPLSTLLLAGVREVLIISTPKALPRFEELFGSGEKLGIHIQYKAQPEPRGIAEAFILGEDFIGQDSVWLVLGDNLFYGGGLSCLLQKTSKQKEKSVVFAYSVSDPERYGVVEFNEKGEVLSIEEKPKQPKSNYAVTGLYYYHRDVVSLAKSLKPSERGELEITDLNRLYLERRELQVELLGRGFAWLDTGTYDSLLEAAEFVSLVEKRQGLKIGCIEEIAYRMGYIQKKQVLQTAESMKNTSYSEY